MTQIITAATNALQNQRWSGSPESEEVEEIKRQYRRFDEALAKAAVSAALDAYAASCEWLQHYYLQEDGEHCQCGERVALPGSDYQTMMRGLVGHQQVMMSQAFFGIDSYDYLRA